jgi:hypothetical protein
LKTSAKFAVKLCLKARNIAGFFYAGGKLLISLELNALGGALPYFSTSTDVNVLVSAIDFNTLFGIANKV